MQMKFQKVEAEKMKTKLCKTILGLFVFVAIFSSTVFAEVKFSFAFPSEYVPDQILVRFSPKSDGSQKDKTEKDQFLASLNAGEVKHSFKRVPGLTVVKLPNGLSVQEALSKLKNKNEILYAEPDSIIYPDSITPNDPYFKQQWALNNTGQTCGTPGASIHAPESWDLIHDANDSIIIAVIDTGIDYTHPDISANMWNGNPYHGYDFCTWNGKLQDSNPMDDFGHGTTWQE
jgi:subtilisin family serine protease